LRHERCVKRRSVETSWQQSSGYATKQRMRATCVCILVHCIRLLLERWQYVEYTRSKLVPLEKRQLSTPFQHHSKQCVYILDSYGYQCWYDLFKPVVIVACDEISGFLHTHKITTINFEISAILAALRSCELHDTVHTITHIHRWRINQCWWSQITFQYTGVEGIRFND